MYSLPTVSNLRLFGAILVYCAVFTAIRLLTAPSIAVDAELEQLNAQLWAWGYELRQPPLYTWLLAAVQTAVGPGLISHLVLKYALLTGIVLLYGRLAMQLLGSRLFGILAGLSLLSLWQIGWNLHEGVTHTLALTLCCVLTATIWADLRRRRRLTGYALLGLALGAGLLSKFGFIAFVACLVGASALQPTWRRVMLHPGVMLSACIAALIVAPYGLWLLGMQGDLAAVFTGTVGADAPVSNRLTAMLGAALAALGFVSPFLILTLIACPALLRSIRSEPISEGEKLCRDACLVGLALLALGVLFLGVEQIRARWLHPFLLLLPIWLLGRLQRADMTDAQLRRFGIVLILAIGAMAAGRLTANLIAEPLCGACRPLIPYDGLIAGIERAGFSQGMIISDDRFTAANLLAAFPTSFASALDRPNAPQQPADFRAESCLYVFVDPPVDFPGAWQEIVTDWPHLWRPDGWRQSRWSVSLQPSSPTGRCPAPG